MTNNLAIFGAGGLGKEYLALIRTINSVNPQWHITGFFDDAYSHMTTREGLPVLGGMDAVKADPPDYLLVAMGDPRKKAEVLHRLKGVPVKFPVLIHPAASIDDPATIRIGEGSVITAGCRLTTGITIGKHVLINLNTTIGHDTLIEDFASLMPGVNIAGGVYIGEKTFVGSGTNIINRIRINRETVIGAGSVVIRDVPAGQVMAGVPAKPLHV